MNRNRKLTSSEQAMEIMNQLNGSFNVITISKIKGYLQESLVRQSLNLVQQRHSFLNSRITSLDSSDTLYFDDECTIEIPLQIIVQSGTTESWQDVVVNELNRSINSGKCLIECFLIYHQDLAETIWFLTKIHHAICDGLSTIRLHEEILSNCQKINSQLPIQPTQLPIIPPVTQLLPQWLYGWRGQINQLVFIAKLQLKEKFYSPQTLKSKQRVSIQLRQCGMVHKRLNPQITQKLLQLCRQEKTTIQGMVCAAILLATKEQIVCDRSADRLCRDRKSNVNLTCHSYVDLRRRLVPEISQNELGFLASFLISFHKVNSTTKFWDLARNVTKQNQMALQKGDFWSIAQISGKIIKHSLAKSDRLAVSAAVSNVGQVNVTQDYDIFKLEEISFVPANSVFTGFLMAAVTTYHYTMMLNFSFSKPSLSQEKAETIADYAINLLRNLSQSKF